MKLIESKLIYNGPFTLKGKSTSINYEGNIYLNWGTNANLKLKTTKKHTNSNFDVIDEVLSDEGFEIIVDNEVVGKCDINTNNELVIGNCWYLKLGNYKDLINKVEFLIPNLKDIISKNQSGQISTKKLILIGPNFTIELKKLENNFNLKNGLYPTYEGRLIFSNCATVDKCYEILNQLRLFLTFIQGNSINIHNRKGYSNNNLVFHDATIYYQEHYKSAGSWTPQIFESTIKGTWNHFYQLSQDNNFLDFFNTLMHWYIYSNRNAGLIEGAIVFGQTALELIYNFHNESLQVKNRNRSRNMSTKIEWLCIQLNFKNEYLKGFKHISSIYSKLGIKQGQYFEVITQARNALVHANKKKRKKYNKLDSMERFEISQLTLLLIEVLTLNILNYKGKIRARRDGGWIGTNEHYIGN